MFGNVNWIAIGAIATSASALVVMMSAIVLARQLIELRRATWANSFLGCVSRLQDESLRETREMAFRLKEKAFDRWTEDEKKIVDRVCHNYDIVGIMARWGMIPKEIIIDSWCDSIRRLWPICEPRVRERRAGQKAPEFWDDFEWLASEAEKYDASRRRSKGKRLILRVGPPNSTCS